MFSSMSILVLSYIVFYFTNRGKVIKTIMSIFLVLSLGMYGAYVYSLQKSGVFSLLTSRLHEDTRSGVIRSFYADMSTKDWLIGRGVNGQYFCPGIDEGDRITVYRSVIESGHLQIVLKGGLISLVLFLCISVPAIIKGLFYSKNILSKAAAIWIFWYFINLYTATSTVFNLNYLLVWISIGICYKSGIRKKTDNEIKEELV